MKPSRLAVSGQKGRRVPSALKVLRARLKPAAMAKLGAGRPFRKLSHSGRSPGVSHTLTVWVWIITITAQPRSWSIQSQRFEGVRSVQIDMGRS